MDKLISVIIPCYNAVHYVRRCYQSLYSQTYTHWEAVFIDDGSKDNTCQELNQLVSIDKRVIVVKQTNMGAAMARYTGLLRATGEYITFLDVDDTLENHALAVLKGAISEDTDIVVSGFRFVGAAITTKKGKYKEKYLESIDYLKGVLSGHYGWELCGKLYKREIVISGINKVPRHLKVGEDATVFIQVVMNSKRVRILSENIYVYHQIPNSASHIKSVEYAFQCLQAATLKESILRNSPLGSALQTEIDAMCLLSFSTSTRKAYLSLSNPSVSQYLNKHLSIAALKKIPVYKAMYILLYICYCKTRLFLCGK